MDICLSITLNVIFGLLIGSFLNVVIYRLPIMLENEFNTAAKQQLGIEEGESQQQSTFNLMTPPSRCGNCGDRVRPWQNIPIISWLLLKGKCHNCQTPISIRYPLVELLTGILFGVMTYQYNEISSNIVIGACLFSAFIIALTFIDADTQILPDWLTLPLVWLGLLFNLITDFVPLSRSVIGAVAGYMSLWLLYKIFKLVTGKEGMGYGDFKLLSAIGAWLGVAVLPIVVLVASLVGIIVALIKQVNKGQPMAFGPCLAISGWFVFLFHNKANEALLWWLQKSGF